MATTILITLFAASLLGIASMLGSKVYSLQGVHHVESHTTHHFYRDLSLKAFGKYRVAQRIFRYILLRVSEKLLRVIAILLRAFIRALILVNARIQKQLASVTSLVRGKPSVERPLDPEKASMYLKDIARHKDEVRNGNHGGE